MENLVTGMILVIAVLHLYFFYLETFLWTTPKGLKIFNRTLAEAQSSKTLAANQGVYNGLLGIGLLGALVLDDPAKKAILVYTLSFIIVAGIYGGMTASKKIALIQALPAAVALALIFMI